MAYTFGDATAPSRKNVQYFENNASRGIYNDGWFACAFGPFVPWDTASTAKRLAEWDINTEPWELYHLDEDFSQANDLAAARPDKLEELKELFKEVSRDNLVWPVGAGLWTRMHPEDRIASPYTKWRFDQSCSRMPEFNAPGLGRQDSRVEVALTVGENASGVIYALGGFSGGVTLFMDNGTLVYEYNMMIIDRFQARSAAPITAGHHVITVDTAFESPTPMSPATVTLCVDGTEVGRVAVARTVSAVFTASETFGVEKISVHRCHRTTSTGGPSRSRAPSIALRSRCRPRGAVSMNDLDVGRPPAAVPRQCADAHRDSDPVNQLDRRPWCRNRRRFVCVRSV